MAVPTEPRQTSKPKPTARDVAADQILCPNGHLITRGAAFCGECGIPMWGGQVPLPRSPERAATGSVLWKRRSLVEVVVALVALSALFAGGLLATNYEWRRALTDEKNLTAAHNRIGEQDSTISGLNGQVSDLNERVSKLSTDLSKAQDEAAINGVKADRFGRAGIELANADDLMHQAVQSIAHGLSAIGDSNFSEANFYFSQARGQIDAATQYEQNAISILHGG